MELRQLRYFVVLAREGNYLNAAAELFVSQSQLSKKIMALEQELGVTLIDRSKRKIAITEEGRLVLKHAKEIMDAHQAMIRELAELKGLPPPALAILAIPVLAPYKIPNLLARFRKSEPDLEIQLEEAEANVILPALVRGDAELGMMRETFVDPSQFHFLPFFEDEVVTIVPVTHPLADREMVDLADLKDERFIFLDKPTLLYDFYTELCGRKGFEPSVAHTSTRTENVIDIVASGAGVSLMMREVVKYSEHEGVIQLALTESVKSVVGFAWSRQARLSKGAKRFVSFVEKTTAFTRS